MNALVQSILISFDLISVFINGHKSLLVYQDLLMVRNNSVILQFTPLSYHINRDKGNEIRLNPPKKMNLKCRNNQAGNG